MNYEIEFKPRALKDLRDLTPENRHRITEKIAVLEVGLSGDVKRLTNFTPEYRL
jgi:mRNA interferase RelE/StbE